MPPPVLLSPFRFVGVIGLISSAISSSFARRTGRVAGPPDRNESTSAESARFRDETKITHGRDVTIADPAVPNAIRERNSRARRRGDTNLHWCETLRLASGTRMKRVSRYIRSARAYIPQSLATWYFLIRYPVKGRSVTQSCYDDLSAQRCSSPSSSLLRLRLAVRMFVRYATTFSSPSV